MNNGYVKVAAATPKIVIGDCGHNKLEIAKMTEEAYKNGAQLIVFPELCITGYIGFVLAKKYVRFGI